MKRWLLGLSLGLAACTKPCPLEDFALLPAGATDCGALTLSGTDAAAQAAHDCVLGAAAGRRPFRVIWQARGMDSNLRSALVGTGTELRLFRWDGDVRGGGHRLDRHPQVHASLCASISVRTGCTAAADDLCLECGGESAPSLLCADP